MPGKLGLGMMGDAEPSSKERRGSNQVINKGGFCQLFAELEVFGGSSPVSPETTFGSYSSDHKSPGSAQHRSQIRVSFPGVGPSLQKKRENYENRND